MSGVARFAWAVLGYNLLVIVWGAFVRATGSGAGCGNHWPLCNGEVVPRSPGVETLIEFGHRTTSGLALLAVIALFVWTRRARPAGHPARLGAWLSQERVFRWIPFILVEGTLILVIVIPFLLTIYISFLRWRANRPFEQATLTGFRNYEQVLTDDGFWLSLGRCLPPLLA